MNSSPFKNGNSFRKTALQMVKCRTDVKYKIHNRIKAKQLKTDMPANDDEWVSAEL